jgi:hypothetical protein
MVNIRSKFQLQQEVWVVGEMKGPYKIISQNATQGTYVISDGREIVHNFLCATFSEATQPDLKSVIKSSQNAQEQLQTPSILCSSQSIKYKRKPGFLSRRGV